MNISLEHLQLLDIIDRTGSFSAASNQLFKAKSAVTYAVKQMEEMLGVSLFDRSGHKPILTEAGKLLLRDGRRLLSNAHDLEGKLKSLATGWDSTFRIAIDEAISFEIFPLVEKFYHTNHHTNLHIRSELLGGCWDAMLNHRADLAIGVTGLMPERNDFTLIKIGLLHFDFVVGKDHPLAQDNDILTSEKINQYPAIYVMDSARSLPEQNYDTQSPKQSLSVGSIHEKKLFISKGVGIGFLPHAVAERAHNAGELLIKKASLTRQPAQMAIAYHQSLRKSKVLQWWLKQLDNITIS